MNEDEELEREGLEGGSEGLFEKRELGEKEVKDDKKEEEGEKELDTKNDSSNKDIENVQNKQIKWSIFIMVSVILVIVLIFFVKANFIDKFRYGGLTFQKTQLGDIIFYSTRFPIVTGTGQVVGDYAVNLRNDPRKLDSIPINISRGRIDFTVESRIKYGPVYVTLDPTMEVCEDSGIALLTLSGFLRDSNLDIQSAVTDKNYAEENNLTYRGCDDSGFDTVIIIREGEETIINEVGLHCYEIKFNDCEILQASERFILSLLEQYASRFEELANNIN